MHRTSVAVAVLLLAVLPAQAQWLPPCADPTERSPVALWEPVFDDLGNLTAPPPVGDGRVIYVFASLPESIMQCAGKPLDNIYSLRLPNNPAALEAGGTLVNMQGGIAAADGNCIVSGYYLNEPLYGMKEGWTQTYFGLVDKRQLVLSGAFCLDSNLPQDPVDISLDPPDAS